MWPGAHFQGTFAQAAGLRGCGDRFPTEDHMQAEDMQVQDRASRRDASGRPVLSTREARQGVTGQNVRYVLVFGLAAVVIAFAVGYLAAGWLG
jgi:hypothetical protein